MFPPPPAFAPSFPFLSRPLLPALAGRALGYHGATFQVPHRIHVGLAFAPRAPLPLAAAPPRLPPVPSRCALVCPFRPSLLPSLPSSPRPPRCAFPFRRPRRRHHRSLFANSVFAGRFRNRRRRTPRGDTMRNEPLSVSGEPKGGEGSGGASRRGGAGQARDRCGAKPPQRARQPRFDASAQKGRRERQHATVLAGCVQTGQLERYISRQWALQRCTCRRMEKLGGRLTTEEGDTLRSRPREGLDGFNARSRKKCERKAQV